MNILVVDDSKTILSSLKYSIEKTLGLTVYTATSMKECADLILKHKGKFKLALLDYNLPDAQNGEIITFIQKFNIPSILLTGSQLDNTNEIFKNKNLIDYIIKDGSYAIEYTLNVVKRFIYNENAEILVIDDSKTFAAKMEGLCTRYNLKTIVNYSAKDALKTIKQRPNIKLILVDYMMPEMNGLEFTKELRKTYKKDEVAIIALSGTSEKAIVASFVKYGANDFLYKDFSNEEFFARVNNNLEVIELFQSTQDKAKKDYLTGVFNKSYLMREAQGIYDYAKEKKELLSAIYIEIDEFKVINDSYGHDIGDEAVKIVSQILLNHLNTDSLIARFADDRFCIIFKNRPYAEIHQEFTQIKEKVSQTPLNFRELSHNFTISIGATVNYGENFDDMLELADEALFKAQSAGTNQIIIKS